MAEYALALKGLAQARVHFAAGGGSGSVTSLSARNASGKAREEKTPPTLPNQRF
jgi:hypothetical protein